MNADSPPQKDVVRSWVKFWNTASVIALGVATAIALYDLHRSPVSVLLILAFAVVYGLWYWNFIIRLASWGRTSTLVALTHAAVMLAMAGMAQLHSVYLFLLVSQYGLIYSIFVMRLAIPLGILLSALAAAVVIITNQMELNEAAGVIFGFAVSAVFGILMGRFISTIIRQNYERQAMINELQAARAELAQAERQAGIFDERQRPAREIHDTLAQGFTSIVTQLEAADQNMPDTPELETARRFIGRALATARESLSESRRFVWALRTEPLERETLAQALRRVAQREEAEAGIQIHVEISGDEHPLPSAYEVTLLRASQEALANVRKHASARHVDLTLTYMDDQVILDVQDDGRGFDPAAPQPNEEAGGFGLIGIRERAEQLGGSLIVESAPGEGSTLVVSLPLAQDEEAPQAGNPMEAV